MKRNKCKRRETKEIRLLVTLLQIFHKKQQEQQQNIIKIIS